MGELKEIKKEAKDKIKQIKTEHDVIVRFTRGDKEEPFLNYVKEEMEEMYGERKPRKYAGLAVELFAIVEQTLKDIYVLYYGKAYQKKKVDKSNEDNKEKKVNKSYGDNKVKSHIDDIQLQLQDYVTFSKDINELRHIRNTIVHNIFHFDLAVEKYDKENKKNVSGTENSKDTLDRFEVLLENAKEYIKGIKSIKQ